jgi:transcriptional regulator with PAS, ATPase and Fis domain
MLDGGLTVLVQGETGVGKEVFARDLHRNSGRGQQAFIAINCAALPENLIEAELFGYEEGAFTGARRKGSPGLLRQADGGSLFLDEIGDMPLMLQSRLLRVLQKREVLPLGSGKPQAIDIQLICATHQNLPAMIEAGAFRPDLYYRIAQYSCTLPALREQGDLKPLLRELWARLQGSGSTTPPLEPEIGARLARHTWPGNYRQLQATVRRLHILSANGHQPRRSDLPDDLGTNTCAADVNDLRSHTDQRMHAAMAAAGGNISEAARQLGINRSTLYRRILSAHLAESSADF